MICSQCGLVVGDRYVESIAVISVVKQRPVEGTLGDHGSVCPRNPAIVDLEFRNLRFSLRFELSSDTVTDQRRRDS